MPEHVGSGEAMLCSPRNPAAQCSGRSRVGYLKEDAWHPVSGRGTDDDFQARRGVRVGGGSVTVKEGRMNGIKVNRKELERAARVYRTNKDAAAALGIAQETLGRACKREGIETPWARERRRHRRS